MAKLICPRCMTVHHESTHGRCPQCNLAPPRVYDFTNSDDYLKREVPRVLQEKKGLALEGLVGGLDSVIINTEPDQQPAAVEELLQYTGLEFSDAFEENQYRSCVITAPGSANFRVRSRKESENPFADLNKFPKSQHLPNTRLETFVFQTRDIEKYVSVQKSRGVTLLIEGLIDLVGSPEEGLKQTFSEASAHTLLINEYIHRYGDFDGFFTKGNVTLLTEATEIQ